MHVVTGASSGIGSGLVVALGRRGVPTLAVARRRDLLQEVASAAGPSVVPLVADVARATGRAAIAEAVGHGPVASVVHAAGSLIPLAPWVDLQPEALADHFLVHVAAPIALTKALLDRGSVERAVVIDSYAATTPRIGWSAYAMVKAAAQMSARAAREELSDTTLIRVFPGAVESPLLRTALDGPDDVPAVEFYRSIADDGQVSDPREVGVQIAEILIDVPLAELRAKEIWNVGHSA